MFFVTTGNHSIAVPAREKVKPREGKILRLIVEIDDESMKIRSWFSINVIGAECVPLNKERGL